VRKFKLGPVELDANVEDSGTVVSEHSGKSLPHIQINFSARPESVDLIKRSLAGHQLESIEVGGALAKWSVETWSESYTGDPWRSDHKFRAELRLQEELAVTELIVDDLSFRPYSYEETTGRDGLEVTARVKLSGPEAAALRKLRSESKSMRVIRRGISDTPRQMRFGRLMWSGDDTEYKFNIALFDEGTVMNSLLNDPIITYPGSTSVRTQSKLGKLIEVLKSKGLLDDTELSAVNTATPTEEDWYAFDRVDDLDTHLDH